MGFSEKFNKWGGGLKINGGREFQYIKFESYGKSFFLFI